MAVRDKIEILKEGGRGREKVEMVTVTAIRNNLFDPFIRVIVQSIHNFVAIISDKNVVPFL